MYRTAERHALLLSQGDPVSAYNLRFRCGPCDICGGTCLCLDDDRLKARLKTGYKPVGTFVGTSMDDAVRLAAALEAEGLATWLGVNRWRVHIVVASKHPDTVVPGAGTPRDRAFTQEFIDERLSFAELGALYGYPSLCSLLTNFPVEVLRRRRRAEETLTEQERNTERKPRPRKAGKKKRCHGSSS